MDKLNHYHKNYHYGPYNVSVTVVFTYFGKGRFNYQLVKTSDPNVKDLLLSDANTVFKIPAYYTADVEISAVFPGQRFEFECKLHASTSDEKGMGEIPLKQFKFDDPPVGGTCFNIECPDDGEIPCEPGQVGICQGERLVCVRPA